MFPQKERRVRREKWRRPAARLGLEAWLPKEGPARAIRRKQLTSCACLRTTAQRGCKPRAQGLQLAPHSFVWPKNPDSHSSPSLQASGDTTEQMFPRHPQEGLLLGEALGHSLGVALSAVGRRAAMTALPLPLRTCEEAHYPEGQSWGPGRKPTASKVVGRALPLRVHPLPGE